MMTFSVTDRQCSTRAETTVAASHFACSPEARNVA